MVIDKKPDSGSLLASVFTVNILLFCIHILNFQQVVGASCAFNDGQIGKCVKFEECPSAVSLSQKGVNPGFCSLEEGIVCCIDYKNSQRERRPSQKRLSQTSSFASSSTNVQDPYQFDSNFQKKKHSVEVDINGNGFGKKKNAGIIEEPYKFETPNNFYSDSEVTNTPSRRPSRPNEKNNRNEEGYFVPPGLVKKKPWRDEKTTENDYYYEHVTKKQSRGPSRKGSNKHTGNSYDSNNAGKWGDINTTRRPEWLEQERKRTTSNWYNGQNDYENNYNNQRTSPKSNNWEQETYITTKRPDYYSSGTGNNYEGNGDEYFNAKPIRRPSNPSNGPKYQQGSQNQGNTRPNYQQGSSFEDDHPTYQHQSQNQGNKRPNYQQGSNFQGNRPNYQEGSSFGSNHPSYQQGSQNQVGKRPTNQQEFNFEGNRPNYQQESNFEGNHPNYQLGSNFEGNRPSSRPGPQKRRISEQKCEEYSKQVIENITGLPLTTNPDPVIIPIRKCITPQQLIVGGENTTIGEFPHMAAIGFRDRNKKEIAWNCGGTLISEQFVMTAAHCTSTSFGRPVKVRLGEYNLMKNDDGAHPVDYGIAEIVTHPDYKPPSKYNDIALLKLSRKVSFYKHIRPACLYSEETFSASKAIATGWGRMYYDGGTSEILQKVVLSIVDNNTCNRLYKINVKTEVLSRGIVNSQLCAGELSGGKDTCQGDSGGPLSITSSKCIHHIIGVTSFGKSCALPNSTGVYTRVSAYVPWIESVVWS